LKSDEELLHLKSLLSDKEVELYKSNEAIFNLQSALEQFQSQQEHQINSEISILKKEIENLKRQNNEFIQKNNELTKISQRCSEAETTARETQDALTQKTKEYIRLQEELQPLRVALQKTTKQVESLLKNEKETLVDKRLVSKLFATYLENKADKNQIMELMAKILDFTEEERKKIGLLRQQSSSWFGFWGNETKQQPTEKSFSEMWVEFLTRDIEKEEPPK